MNNTTRRARFAIAMVLTTGAFAISRDAGAAGTCSGGGGTSSVGTSPTAPFCTFALPLTAGPGASQVAQDQSTVADSNTFGLEATSLNNTAIYAYSDNGEYSIYSVSGSGIGIVGIGYGSGVTPPTGYYGVYGTSAAGDGVHGEVSTGENGVAGANDGDGDGVSGTAVGTGDGVYGGNSGTGYGIYATASGNDALHADIDSGYSGISVGQTGGGYGLYVTSSSTSNAVGRFVSTGSYNAIYATNTRTDHTAAVISAAAGSSAGLAYYGNGSINITGYYLQNGSCVAGCPSDERLKKNIVPMSSAMDDLLRLRGVTYEWKDPQAQGRREEGMRRGFIAQDVEKVFPQWVDQDDSGIKRLQIRQNEIEAMEVESIRTLKMQNDSLAEQVKELQSGRRVVAGFDLNGIGFGVGGLAIAGAILVSRRKREDQPKTIA